MARLPFCGAGLPGSSMARHNAAILPRRRRGLGTRIIRFRVSSALSGRQPRVRQFMAACGDGAVQGVWLPEFARLSAIRAAGWLQAESGPAQGWAGKRYRQRSEAAVPPGEGFVLLRPGISAASVDCRRWR